MGKASPRTGKQALAALLAMGGLLFCLGMPVCLLHSLANGHRALYEFVGRQWSPFFRAIWRLRSVPSVSHIPPVPGSEGKYEVGIAYKWQLGDFTGIDLSFLEEDSSDPFPIEEQYAMRLLDLNDVLFSAWGPLIDGVHMIHTWSHFTSEGCHVGWRWNCDHEPKDPESQLSLPILAVADQEVYPFSSHWGKGAIIWGWHRYHNMKGEHSDLIFVAGVTSEVAESVEKAVRLVVDLGVPVAESDCEHWPQPCGYHKREYVEAVMRAVYGEHVTPPNDWRE